MTATTRTPAPVLVRTGETVDILLDVTTPDDGRLTATSPSTTRAG